MKNDARVGALASWSEQSRYYVCFVNVTLNNSPVNPSQVVFTLGCLLSCVVCGSLRHLLSLPVDLPFPSSWWPPQSSQRSSTQAVLLSLCWEEVKSSGWLTQDSELCLLLRHCVGGNHCLFKEFAAPERPDSAFTRLVAECGSLFFASPETLASVGVLWFREMSISHSSGLHTVLWLPIWRRAWTQLSHWASSVTTSS